MTESGTVPCVRIGRSVRYCLEGLRAWVMLRQNTAAF
jgi:hypothetical protein